MSLPVHREWTVQVVSSVDMVPVGVDDREVRALREDDATRIVVSRQLATLRQAHPNAKSFEVEVVGVWPGEIVP